MRKHFTFHSTDALDPVPNLHIVTFKRHEDPVGVVGLPLRVHLRVAVLELEPVIAVVLRHFAVHLKVFLHPAEGHEDLPAGPPTFDAGLVVDQAVDLLEFGTADDGRRLGGLRRVLLAADAGISHPRAGSHQGGMRQEAEGGVAGATVPQQHRDEREEGADDDEGLVVHPCSQTAHGYDFACATQREE